MNSKKGNFAELAYVMGMILCPLGVCLSAKSGFGVSMVVAPAYVLYLRISETLPWFTFGKSEYIFQGLLLILLGIAVRRFKWKYLLSLLQRFFTEISWISGMMFWEQNSIQCSGRGECPAF